MIRETGQWIVKFAPYLYLKVQMRRRGPAGLSHQRYPFPCLDFLSGLDQNLLGVCIARQDSFSVIDQDHLAVILVLTHGARKNDFSISTCFNRFSAVCSDIETAVEGPVPVTKWRRQTPVLNGKTQIPGQRSPVPLVLHFA